MGTRGRLTICQISDIHCGSTHFVPDLLERSILEINYLNPTAVVVSGDLTDAGYRQEFEAAAEYVRRFQCGHVMVIPGNRDSRNVGYIHFERLSGERDSYGRRGLFAPRGEDRLRGHRGPGDGPGR